MPVMRLIEMKTVFITGTITAPIMPIPDRKILIKMDGEMHVTTVFLFPMQIRIQLPVQQLIRIMITFMTGKITVLKYIIRDRKMMTRTAGEMHATTVHIQQMLIRILLPVHFRIQTVTEYLTGMTTV